jgi:hypothetical protein
LRSRAHCCKRVGESVSPSRVGSCDCTSPSPVIRRHPRPNWQPHRCPSRATARSTCGALGPPCAKRTVVIPRIGHDKNTQAGNTASSDQVLQMSRRRARHRRHCAPSGVC